MAGNEILRDAEPQAAAQAVAPEQRLHLALDLKHGARMRKQRLAVTGQHHLVRVAREEPSPERGLQPLDVLADRRLPEAEPFCGERETAHLFDGDETAKL